MPPDRRTSGLTYEPFYGLREKPFSLTSDARFFYPSRAHAPAFDDLLNAIRRRESLNVLTGDVGTGKTTLCRAVLENLDRKAFSAFVPDPFLSREDLLKVLLMDFGVASVDDFTTGRLRAASRSELSYLLYEFLGTLAPLQAFAVVFIDEAQNLSLPLLEETRILSDADGQLQVVLVGQLELRDKLQLPEMRQLDQRVSVHCRLAPLDLVGVAGYISHRLHRAGGSADRLAFSGDAVEAIYERTHGVPRLINRVCDRALRQGHSRRVAIIDRAIVEDANPAPESQRTAVGYTAASAAAIPVPTAIPAAPAILAAHAIPVSPGLPSAAAVPPAPVPHAVPPALDVAPVSSSFTTPAIAPMSRLAASQATDPIDAWLADIDNQHPAPPGGASLPTEEEWRQRWAATAAPADDDRGHSPALRIRIGWGRPAHRHQVMTRAHRVTRRWTRRGIAGLLGLMLLYVAALIGPTVLSDTVDLLDRTTEQFTPPRAPDLPPPPRITLPPPAALGAARAPDAAR